MMVVARKSRKQTNQRMFEPSDEEKLVKPSSWTAVFDDIARTLRGAGGWTIAAWDLIGGADIIQRVEDEDTCYWVIGVKRLLGEGTPSLPLFCANSSIDVS